MLQHIYYRKKASMLDQLDALFAKPTWQPNAFFFSCAGETNTLQTGKRAKQKGGKK